jgi:hypothetical protein
MKHLKLILSVAIALTVTVPAQSQILKKLKNKVEKEVKKEVDKQINGNTSSTGSSTASSQNSTSSGNGGEGIATGIDVFGQAPPKPEFKIEDLKTEVTEDEFGISGVYYLRHGEDIIPNIFNLAMCKGMSTIKGAEDVPDCFEIFLTIGYYNDYREPDYDRNNFTSNYGYVFNLTNNKKFVADNFGRLGRFYQLEDGVIINPPANETNRLSEVESIESLTDADWKSIIEGSLIFVKDKTKLADWENIDKDYLKAALIEHTQSLSDAYATLEARKYAATEMPTVGTLNSKSIRDLAFKTYNEGLGARNKGWTTMYAYVHQNEWANKVKYDAFGKPYKSHRQTNAVIVRKSPKGECRADLMLYAEPYEDGNYQASKGYIARPVSYVGMPGGIVPCDKAENFKSKTLK